MKRLLIGLIFFIAACRKGDIQIQNKPIPELATAPEDTVIWLDDSMWWLADPKTSSTIYRLADMPAPFERKKLLIFPIGSVNDPGITGGYSVADYKKDYDSVLHYAVNQGWSVPNSTYYSTKYLPK